MKELDICIGELRNAAYSLTAVADGLTALFGGDSKFKEQIPLEQTEPPPKPLSLEDVRAVLAEKSRNGFTAQIRTLLEKHGATKLSEIDPGKYAALLADAEVLSSG